MHSEQIYIGGCLTDNTLVDQGISQGIRSDSFTTQSFQSIWTAMVEQRAKGQIIDVASLSMAMGRDCPLQDLMNAETSAPTSLHSKKAMKIIIWEHQKRSVRPALNDVISLIDDDASADKIVSAVEHLQHYLKPQESEASTLDQLVSECVLWAKQEAAGTRPEIDLVKIGLPSFDDGAGAIEPHEYVVIGARTSIGKSSFMSQVASHNLQRGLRVAYFTLETSGNAVIKQIASQRAKVNLRMFGTETNERQTQFNTELEKLRKQHLRVFDKDMSLAQIESRCRIMAASWKPQLVIIDYLGLIRGTDGSAYERMGQLSKAMIPLKKSVGCALMVAAQLNRNNEREDRAPTRTDFRDAGSIEEDAHRIIAIHRPSTSFGGNPQELGLTTYDYELLQLKLRDGPLWHSRIKYYAPHTTFVDAPTT
jgi:replicative DNA helicase